MSRAGAAYGTWNFADPAKVVAAADVVRTGSAFRLDLPPDFFSPPLFERADHVHELRGDEDDFARDDVIHGWNTQSSTHWDGLRHVREPAGFYAGRRGDELGVEHLAEPGLVTRAVLADVARWRDSDGRPLGMGGSITVADLEATLAHQGSSVEAGDVLLVRTGWVGWYRSKEPTVRRAATTRAALCAPGLLAAQETADWLAGRGVAAIAADNPSVEAWPSPVADGRADESLHVMALVRQGIIFGELWDLDALAAACLDERRWESLLVSAPLAFRGACAAPANAIAIR